ncbi:hypothetical protein [Maridesulfovibrio sp.]|uniref:hypothetical protein n=1 Tax=Maridesulfovibrio sp. TaxID=2795000 RepID=UPI002AA8F4FD|nr:hypothetical protein [Maridesulfovibrio sp.]
MEKQIFKFITAIVSSGESQLKSFGILKLFLQKGFSRRRQNFSLKSAKRIKTPAGP